MLSTSPNLSPLSLSTSSHYLNVSSSQTLGPSPSPQPPTAASQQKVDTPGHCGPLTPASLASPRTTLCRPRLLWKSSLALPDGTLLPGVAFASHIDPFQRRPDAAFGAVSASGTADDIAAMKGQLEAEESLCLALEMVRHRRLQITSIITDMGISAKPASPDALSLASSSRGLSRTSSIPQQFFGAGGAGVSSQLLRRPSGQLDKVTHWLANGEIRVYIDPNEPSTLAFFERHFCTDEELVSGPAGMPPRSRKIFTVSLDGHRDSIGGSTTSASASAPTTSDFALFGQLHVTPPTTPGISRRLSYFGDNLDPSSGSPAVEGNVLSLVIGRKVVTIRKSASATAAPGGGRRGRGPHDAATSLSSIFSQAGLSLPQFGLEPPTASMRTGPRPDDPLPRGSIASLLQARALKRTKSAAAIAGSRSSSPHSDTMAPPVRRSSQSQRPSAAILSSRRTLSSDSLGGSQEDAYSMPQSARSGRARGATGVAVAKNNTPDRRGEKRPRRLLDIDETIDEEDTAAADHHQHQQPRVGRTSLSPSKRRGPKADRIQLGSSSFHSRLLAASRISSGGTTGRPSPSPGITVKGETMTPELPMLPLFDTGEDSLFVSQLGTEQQQPTSTTAAASSASSSSTANTVERSNRTMIKKLVYTILVSERGLRKGDDDFAACYTQAYSGTWCAFRKQGPLQRLDRMAVEKVVRLHLDMYLDGVTP